jgi:23S rRNA pseudouridine2605 synthase
MVFKRPAGGRNERTGGPSGRANGSNNKPKRSTSSRGNSEKSFDRSDKKQSNFSSERPGSSRRPSSAGGSKPYSGRPSNNEDKPVRKSYSKPGEGEPREKRPYSSQRSKPYTGRTSATDGKPERKSYSRSEGRDGGEKRPYSSPRSKPYTGRTSDTDGKPERKSYSRPDKSEGPEKRPYSSSRSKPYSGRTTDGENKPKREFNRDNDNGEGGERKFSSASPRTTSGERKFAGKRSTDNFKDKPYRTERSSSPRKTYTETDAPEKTMRSRKEKGAKDDGLIRLNRYIANAGICSRRKADELIEAGVVSVNGNVVSELGYKINPSQDEIRYNGELLKREKMVYVLLNKPKDYITTTDDPQERRTVMLLVEKASRERIYPIGRLDRNTTGLLLMTNDGDLAEKLSHPRSNVTKLYQVELSKSLTQGDLNKIGFGVELEDGLIKPDSVSYVQGGSKREIGIQIHSGKNRIVRRIFEHLGYEVVKLDRVVYANLTKKDLPRGRWRYLDEKEVIQLKHLI